MDYSYSRQYSSGSQWTPRGNRLSTHDPSANMSLGSPAQSHNTSSYLPGYLLGGHTPTQKAHTHDITYGKNSRNKSPGKIKSWSPSRSLNQSFSGQSKQSAGKIKRDLTHVRHTFSDSRTPKSLRGKAPPVADLFNDSSSPITARSPLHKESHDMDVHMVTVMSQTLLPSQPARLTGSDFKEHLLSPSRKIGESPAQIDPFYSQGESITANETLDECSVTVFGFPPSASSFLLQQFSQYGSILKHEVASAGNWMHIKYQSKLQAKKALSKNGKVFGSNMMVGVKQCIDKNFMFKNGKENLPSTSVTSDGIAPSPSRKTPIRPLTAAYQAASSDAEVSSDNSNTPLKSNNLVSKAMEYVFGW